MKRQKIFQSILAVMLVLPMAFAGSVYAAETPEPPPPEKTVKGFRGEAKTMARQWLSSEKDFVALEFIPGNRGHFWNMGSLEGKLVDGRKVFVEVTDDFSNRNPGMIRAHLKALKFKAEILAYTPQEYKELIAQRVRFHNGQVEEQQALEKEIQEKVELRLKDVLEKELSSEEKSILQKMEKEFEAEVRKQIVSEIENEVRMKFPNASAEKMNIEITSKLNKQSRPRIKKALRRKIMAVDLGAEGGTPEIRKFTERVVTYYRPRIEAEVRAQYAIERSKHLGRLRKKIEGETVKTVKDKTLFGEIKKMLGLD